MNARIFNIKLCSAASKSAGFGAQDAAKAGFKSSQGDAPRARVLFEADRDAPV